MSEGDKNEIVRIGVGVLTALGAWTEDLDEDGQLLGGHVAELINERGERGMIEMIAGLSVVAGILLDDLVAATARSKGDILQDLAAKHQT